MRKLIALIILAALLANTCVPPSYAQTLLNLPAAGDKVGLSPVFEPVLIKGVSVHPENAMMLDFIVDPGDGVPSNEILKVESTKLIKYFMAAVTVPEDDLWVNLSPYEKDRIIPEALGQTELGRDMLAQDYLLKQITASLIDPETSLGRKFWDRIYQESFEKYGTTEIPVDTFNKVWIMPAKALIYENNGKAVIVESRLKVMLEADYLAMDNNGVGAASGRPLEARGGRPEVAPTHTNEFTKEILREIILPALEQEVNTGRNFASLRQVYHSLLLAHWFRNNFKKSILHRMYADKSRIKGVDIDDKQIAQKIYAQYVASFKKGVYNYVKEELDPATQEMTPRKYFSGGEKFDRAALDEAVTTTTDAAMGLSFAQKAKNVFLMAVSLVLPGPKEVSQAQRLIDQGFRVPVIIEKINALGQGLKHSRNGKTYSFVARTNGFNGTKVLVYLKDETTGLESRIPVGSFYVDQWDGYVRNLGEFFDKVSFKDGEETDLTNGHLGTDFNRIVSLALPAGVKLTTEVKNEHTRQWLEDHCSVVPDESGTSPDGTKIVLELDDVFYDIIDDRFDAQGELDRSGVGSGQMMLADLLALRALGRSFTETTRFRNLKIYSLWKDRVDGLDGLKAFLNKKNAPDQPKIHFEWENGPEVPLAGAVKEEKLLRVIREQINGPDTAYLSRAVLESPSEEKLSSWFSPYADFDAKVLADRVRTAFVSLPSMKYKKSFSLTFRQRDAIDKVAGILAGKKAAHVAVASFGPGDFEPHSELVTTVSALIKAYEKTGQTADITFVIYDYALSNLDHYQTKFLAEFKEVIDEKHPDWQGKFNVKVYYADLLGDAADWKAMIGVMPKGVPAIVSWRNTWVGSPMNAEDNRRVLGYKEAMLRLEALKQQMSRAGTGLVIFNEVMDDAPDRRVDIVDIIDNAQNAQEYRLQKASFFGTVAGKSLKDAAEITEINGYTLKDNSIVHWPTIIKFLQRIGFGEGKRVLEIGAGSVPYIGIAGIVMGGNSTYIEPGLEQNFRVNFAPAFYSVKRAGKALRHDELRSGDAPRMRIISDLITEASEINAETFDLVTLCNVMDDPRNWEDQGKIDAIIKGTLSHLKPDGHLVVSWLHPGPQWVNTNLARLKQFARDDFNMDLVEVPVRDLESPVSPFSNLYYGVDKNSILVFQAKNIDADAAEGASISQRKTFLNLIDFLLRARKLSDKIFYWKHFFKQARALPLTWMQIAQVVSWLNGPDGRSKISGLLGIDPLTPVQPMGSEIIQDALPFALSVGQGISKGDKPGPISLAGISDVRLGEDSSIVVLSEEEIASFTTQYPEYNWRKAAEVVWPEQVREKDQKIGGSNQQTYFRNQAYVRRDLLYIIRDLLSGRLSDEQYVENMISMHVDLLTLTGLYDPKLGQWHTLVNAEMVRWMSGNLLSEEKGRKKLMDLKDLMLQFFKKSALAETKNDLVSGVGEFYASSFKVDALHVFTWTNHAWLMQIVNVMLRMNDLNGISHGSLDQKYQQSIENADRPSLETVEAETVQSIKEANADVDFVEVSGNPGNVESRRVIGESMPAEVLLKESRDDPAQSSRKVEKRLEFMKAFDGREYSWDVLMNGEVAQVKVKIEYDANFERFFIMPLNAEAFLTPEQLAVLNEAPDDPSLPRAGSFGQLQMLPVLANGRKALYIAQIQPSYGGRLVGARILKGTEKASFFRDWARHTVKEIIQAAGEEGVEDVFVTTPAQIRTLYRGVSGSDANFYYGKPLGGMARVQENVTMTFNWHGPLQDLQRDVWHVKTTDQAEARVEGGIDFKARNMNVDIKGEGVDFQLPEEMQGVDWSNIEGLTPVIINVTPMTNMPAYLGLSAIPAVQT